VREQADERDGDDGAGGEDEPAGSPPGRSPARTGHDCDRTALSVIGA